VSRLKGKVMKMMKISMKRMMRMTMKKSQRANKRNQRREKLQVPVVMLRNQSVNNNDPFML
jgi:hypothetical protein